MGQKVVLSFMVRQLTGLTRWKILYTLLGINRPALFCRAKTAGKWKILWEPKTQKSKPRNTEAAFSCI